MIFTDLKNFLGQLLRKGVQLISGAGVCLAFLGGFALIARSLLGRLEVFTSNHCVARILITQTPRFPVQSRGMCYSSPFPI